MNNIWSSDATATVKPGATLPQPAYLQLFDALYTTGNVTRAAESLGISQPTASLQLGRLREQFDDPLFLKTPRGMRPTVRADELIDEVREALAVLMRLGLRAMAFDPGSSDRAFHAHMADGSSVTLLPTLLGLLAEQAPEVRLEVTTLSRSTATALRTGDADLAIGYAPWLDREFRRESLYSQDWVCLVRSGHPATARFGIAEYESAHHVDISRRTWSGLLASTLRARDIHRHVTLQLPGVLGLVAVLTAGDLVATLPRHISQVLTTLAPLEIVPCPVPIPTFVLHTYWHVHQGENAGNAWLRGLINGAFAQYDVSGGRRRP